MLFAFRTKISVIKNKNNKQINNARVVWWDKTTGAIRNTDKRERRKSLLFENKIYVIFIRIMKANVLEIVYILS